MILLLAALQAAPIPQPREDDVVVIGRRVREWRGTFKADKNGVSRQCRTKRSTGDLEIDAIGCEATVTCYTQVHGKVAAIMAATKSRKEANRRMASIMNAEMTPCMDRTYRPLVAALAQKRRAARGDGS